MNIYLRELRAHLKSTIIWSAAIFFLVLVGMSKYTAGSGDSGGFNEMLELLPKSLQNIFGVGVFDLSVSIEYYAVLFLYLALMAGLHAVFIGNGIISKEERDKTAEFLLVKPVSRAGIITPKLLAALTILFAFNAVTLFSSAVMLAAYPQFPFWSNLLKLCAAIFGIQLLFCSLGALFAGLMKNVKRSAAASTGVLLCMFMFSIIADISEKAGFLRYLSFFKYFDAQHIMKTGYSPFYPLAALILTCLFTWLAYVFYNKRDMRI